MSIHAIAEVELHVTLAPSERLELEVAGVTVRGDQCVFCKADFSVSRDRYTLVLADREVNTCQSCAQVLFTNLSFELAQR